MSDAERLLRQARHLGRYETLIAHAASTVTDAIRGDGQLTAGQRTALIGLYDAFTSDRYEPRPAACG